ncbi:MAG: hypothetical protein ACP5VR_08925 [Acidimicrobiales bacterium]
MSFAVAAKHDAPGAAAKGACGHDVGVPTLVTVCGLSTDRDLNAAKNLAALTGLAFCAYWHSL